MIYPNDIPYAYIYNIINNNPNDIYHMYPSDPNYIYNIPFNTILNGDQKHQPLLSLPDLILP